MAFGSDALTAPLGRARNARLRGLGPFQIGSLLAVLIISAIIGYAIFTKVWGSGQQAALPYSVAVASRETVTASANASGTVDADRQVKLSFPTAGRLAQLL